MSQPLVTDLWNVHGVSVWRSNGLADGVLFSADGARPPAPFTRAPAQ